MSETFIADDHKAIADTLWRLQRAAEADRDLCARRMTSEVAKAPERPLKPKSTGNPILDWRACNERRLAVAAWERANVEATPTTSKGPFGFGETPAPVWFPDLWKLVDALGPSEYLARDDDGAWTVHEERSVG